MESVGQKTSEKIGTGRLIIFLVCLVATVALAIEAQKPGKWPTLTVSQEAALKTKDLLQHEILRCEGLCLDPDLVVNRTNKDVWVLVDNKQGYFHQSDFHHGTKLVRRGEVIWSCMDNSRFKVFCGR